MTGDLVTFGYTGMRAGDLRPVLGPRVDLVVDVRLNAWSGNVAFSAGVRRTVTDQGFDYLHLPDLGNADYKIGGMRIRNIDAVERVIDELTSGPVGQGVALMCACADVTGCHRLIVADEILARLPGVAVYHRPAFARAKAS